VFEEDYETVIAYAARDHRGMRSLCCGRGCWTGPADLGQVVMNGSSARSGMADEQEIIEGLKPVCICKGIRASVFLKHIRGGVSTVDGLRKATGAGSGSCKGERCTPRMEELLRRSETAEGGLRSRRERKRKK
jgi:bacterioferritin-associated ferredoxin